MIERINQNEKKFTESREHVKDELSYKWQKLQNDYRIDFTEIANKEARKEKTKKNRATIKNIIEAVKILKD